MKFLQKQEKNNVNSLHPQEPLFRDLDLRDRRPFAEIGAVKRRGIQFAVFCAEKIIVPTVLQKEPPLAVRAE